VIAEVVSTNALNAQEKGCRVVVDASCTAYVSGDRILLARALDNVLRNAIEFSPQGGHVDVCLQEVSGRAVVSVRDFGAGVPEAMLASIFEPFFRVDESRQESTGGLGLGLAIVHRAVQSHGGTVQATNAGPGLMVTITLPDMLMERAESPRSAA
jgi:two-component system sensor histidine kinase CpxA